MPLFYSDDPAADFGRWDEYQNRQLELLPKCEHCREHIQDERLMNIEGALYHTECAVEVFGEWTAEHTEER